jgi:AcrR family transcriptional regulator
MKQPPDELAERLYGLGEELLSRGLDLRIDDVAQVAGIPRATLYYYFSGKEDLVAYLMSEKAARMGAGVQKAVAEPGTPVERLRAAIEVMIDGMEESPSLCINLLAAMGHGPAMASLVMSTEQSVFAPLRELLIEGRATGDLVMGELDAACAAIGGAIMLASLRDFVTHGRVRGDELKATLVPQLVEGLRAA